MPSVTVGQAISRELQRVMRERGWTQTRAGKEMNVDRRTIYRWLQGDPMTMEHLEKLATFTDTLTLVIGEQEEAAPPEAERLNEIEGLLRAIGQANGLTQKQMDEAVRLHRLNVAARRSLPHSGGGHQSAGQRRQET